MSDRFDLGDVAPYANGVKIYKQDVDSKDQVLMEVDFSWIGEQDIQLDIKPIPKHLGPLSPAGHLLSSIIRLRVLLSLVSEEKMPSITTLARRLEPPSFVHAWRSSSTRMILGTYLHDQIAVMGTSQHLSKLPVI